VWHAEFQQVDGRFSTITIGLLDGKLLNILHFVNHYCYHTNTPRPTDIDFLTYFTVEKGEGSGRKIRMLLEVLDAASLRRVGYQDPAIPVIQEKLNAIDAAKVPEIKVPIVIELLTYVREKALDFTNRNANFRKVIIEKCESFRKEEHSRFPEVERAASLLLEALGQVPAPLPDEVVMANWAKLPCAFLSVNLQMDDGPVELGILHPKSGQVSTSFYGFEITLEHWFNKYKKDYNISANPRTFVERLKHLRSGSVSFYDMLYHNTVNDHIVLAKDRDMEALDQELIHRYTPDMCQCDLHRPLEEPCDCYHCSQEQALWDEIYSLRSMLAEIVSKK